MSTPQVFSLDASARSPLLPALAALLSGDERAAVDRLHDPADRARAVVGRGGLRRLAGHLLERPPTSLRIDRTPYGKPVLPDCPRLHVSVSHSGDVALVSLALDREVGVDVERVRPDLDEALARALSSRERLALRDVAPARRQDLLLQCWTRKEAYLKAVGTGLSRPPETVPVLRRSPRLGARLARRVDGHRLRALDVGPGYRAALAVRGRSVAPRVHALRDVGPGSRFAAA